MRLFERPPAIVEKLKQTSKRLFDAPEPAEIIARLGAIYTPAQPIMDEELFSGRHAELREIREKLALPGQNIIIFGHRGLGKTSLTLVALRGNRIAHHTCRTGDDFQSIFLAILTQLNEQFSPEEAATLKGAGYEIGRDKWGKVTIKYERSRKESAVARVTLDPNFLMTKLRRWQNKLQAIVIDEFQLIVDVQTQQSIIEAAKILSDHHIHIPVIIIGHASSDSALIQAPNYREFGNRYFTLISLKEMSDEDLADIIWRREVEFNIKFSSSSRQTIIRLAAGYPVIVHTLALFACIDWLATNLQQELSNWSFIDILKYTKAIIKNLSWSIEGPETCNAVRRFVSDCATSDALEFAMLLNCFVASPPTRSLQDVDDLTSVLKGFASGEPVEKTVATFSPNRRNRAVDHLSQTFAPSDGFVPRIAFLRQILLCLGFIAKSYLRSSAPPSVLSRAVLPSAPSPIISSFGQEELLRLACLYPVPVEFDFARRELPIVELFKLLDSFASKTRFPQK